MIGANGVGKTSVLDVLSLLASSAAGKMSTSISELGGLTSILTYDRANELELGITMEVAGHQPLQYSLCVRSDGIAYRIEQESLSQRRRADPPPFLHITARGPDVQYFEGVQGRLVRPNWKHNPLETSLSQVPKMFQEPEDFRTRLASSTFYHVLDVSARSPVRLPQPMQPSTLPGKNGEELVSCLFYLRETERHRFEAIEDALRRHSPDSSAWIFHPLRPDARACVARKRFLSPAVHASTVGGHAPLFMADNAPAEPWLNGVDAFGRARGQSSSGVT